MIHGADVSNHQPNWRPDVGDAFTFILTSDGHTWKSPTHDAQVKLARKAKQIVGHYHWLRHGDIQAQAEWFVKRAKPKAGDILICDWEQGGTTTADKNQFLAAVKKLKPKNRVLLYCSRSWWAGSDRKSGDGLWMAEYGVTTPGSNDWLIWQYADHKGSMSLDQNRAKFASKKAMRQWAKIGILEASKRKKTATVATTLAGTPLDLSDVPTGSGTRFKFRDRLTNTSGNYPGCVCECIPRWVALVEALAKEQHIPVPLQFWQGSWSGSPSSAGTHAGGGALDIKITGLTAKQVQALVKICRLAGGMAYLRDRQHGNFDTPHIHVGTIGCKHASAQMRTQWSQYKAGRDALALNGPDYGPRVPYITAAKAFKKLTKSGGVPADSEDWLEMATQKEVQAAMVAALKQVLTGDIYPSPSLNPDSVKKNPFWSWPSMVYWSVKLTSLIRRDMPTKKQLDELIAAVKALKEGN
jgi:hypothetical protein